MLGKSYESEPEYLNACHKKRENHNTKIETRFSMHEKTVILLGMSDWTFLTNYAHVVICLARDPDARLRDVAEQVGITERATQRIVHDLVEEGFIKVEKNGRRNSYKIIKSKHLRHQIERHCRLVDLIEFLKPVEKEGTQSS